MKKAILIAILILAMMSSVMAGTLASYTITLTNVASGSVTSKEFVFTEDGEDSFHQNIKIAPSETVVWDFRVKNYDGSTITETDMYYKLTFNVSAINKKPIEPLIVTIKDENGKPLYVINGTGKAIVTAEFPVSDLRQSDRYFVEIYWPSDDKNDIKYAGNNYGTSVNVTAVASQLPFADSRVMLMAEENSGINVSYESATPDPETGKYDFQVKITNNTNSIINDWDIKFRLDDTVESVVDAVKSSDAGLGEGQYQFRCTNQNISIQPGESVTFSGVAIGNNKEISDVTVSGESAQVVNSELGN